MTIHPRREMRESTKRIIATIAAVLEGQVMSYGEVARRAGLPNGARQVARILHSSSKKHHLPWHRVINSQGKISLTGDAYRRQKKLLLDEGVVFGKGDRIELG